MVDDELGPLWIKCGWMDVYGCCLSILMIPFSSSYLLAGRHLRFFFVSCLCACVWYDICVSLGERIICMALVVISKLAEELMGLDITVGEEGGDIECFVYTIRYLNVNLNKIPPTYSQSCLPPVLRLPFDYL